MLRIGIVNQGRRKAQSIHNTCVVNFVFVEAEMRRRWDILKAVFTQLLFIEDSLSSNFN